MFTADAEHTIHFSFTAVPGSAETCTGSPYSTPWLLGEGGPELPLESLLLVLRTATFAGARR
eukprot:764529-Hanusia_phi.AAC.13